MIYSLVRDNSERHPLAFVFINFIFILLHGHNVTDDKIVINKTVLKEIFLFLLLEYKWSWCYNVDYFKVTVDEAS